jgi:hypothetical protein
MRILHDRRNGALVHETDLCGKGALHYAVRAGAGDAVVRLLEWRADPNQYDCDGMQPLDEAEVCYVKQPERVEDYGHVFTVLKKHGASHSQLHVKMRRPVLEQWATEQGLSVPWPTCQGEDASARSSVEMVVLNCANIGHEYARAIGGGKGFDWEGVHRVMEYYKARGVQVHAVCSAFTKKRNPIPDRLRHLHQHVIQTPTIDVVGKDVDDLFTLRLAQEHDCEWIDNDNYRNWETERAGVSSTFPEWLKANKARLKIGFIFTKAGQFVPTR